MEKVPGLKTLGDYRRAARESLFSIYLPPTSKSTSAYDAIKTALYRTRGLIFYLRHNPSERDRWYSTEYPTPKKKEQWIYPEFINSELFDYITLMEFAIKYHEVKSIYKLYPDWPKFRKLELVFTSTGDSILKASFVFVLELGIDIILLFQEAYLKYKQGGKRPYLRYPEPLLFLSKTPSIDDLEINPEPDSEPDRIIKTWFDDIVKGMQGDFPKSEYSRHRLKAEFNRIETQLEHEWNCWKETSAGGKSGDKSKPLVPVPITIPVFSTGVEEVHTESEKGEQNDGAYETYIKKGALPNNG